MSAKPGDRIRWTDRHRAAITRGDDGRHYTDVAVTRVEVLSRAREGRP